MRRASLLQLAGGILLAACVSAGVARAETVQTVTQYSYDLRGRLDCTAVRMNTGTFGALPASACSPGIAGSDGPDRVTRIVYDAAGQVLQVQKAYDTPLQQNYATYTYSTSGKRTSVTDANGNRAEMRYDGFDRQTAWYFPSPSQTGSVSTTDYEAYGYDANGNRTSLRRRDGRTLTFAFDALNRMTSKVVPDGCAPIQIGGCPATTATRDVFYGYDLRGLQTYARFASASGEGVTNTYDGFGQLTSSTTMMAGVSRTLSYQYDADGNRARVTHADGVWFGYGYDGMDRVINAQWWSPGSGNVPFFAIAYDALGRRSSTGRASSVSSYGYDGLSRLTSLTQGFAGGVSNVTQGFGYNPASQITQMTSNNDGYAFNGYVNVDRGYQANGLNQYTTAGQASFSYDANGNLVGDGTNSYIYDAENRLVSASNGSVLAYDPLGRLWSTGGGPWGASQFLYDGDAVIAEYDGATGAMRRRFAYGSGSDEPVLWDEGASMNCSGTHFMHPNHQGSVIALADCWGSRIAVNSYDEYGITKNSVDGTITPLGRFGYTGQMWLPELGMYHYKARVYSPTLGRFLQTDPIGYDDQINLYAYVANDPVNGRDPTGTQLSRIPDDLRELWKDFKEAPVATVLDVLGGLEPNPISSIAVEASAARSVVRAEASEASATVKAEKTYQTYTKANPETGQVYTGRTSGTGTPAQNIARRDSGHHMNEQGYGPARLDKSSSNPQAIRGREQQMIERNGGAQSQGGSSGNRINGISDRNTNGPACRAAANREFGPC